MVEKSQPFWGPGKYLRVCRDRTQLHAWEEATDVRDGGLLQGIVYTVVTRA